MLRDCEHIDNGNVVASANGEDPLQMFLLQVLKECIFFLGVLTALIHVKVARALAVELQVLILV